MFYRGGANHFFLIFASPELAKDAVENYRNKPAAKWYNKETKENMELKLRVERPQLTKIIQRIGGSLWKQTEDNENFKNAVPNASKLNGNGAGGKIWLESGEDMSTLFLVTYKQDEFQVRAFYENLEKWGISKDNADNMMAKAKESLETR